MAGDNKISYILDLDAKEFAEKIMDSIEKVENLTKTLKSVATAAGLIGAAFLAVKTSLDLVFEAEHIKSINAQFEILTKQAGIAGDALKEGLDKAAGGLISDNELLQLANKSLVEFGSNADKLPEIMELARKAAVVSGQDIATTFETLSHAIATGQTKSLKNLGIIIDSDQAYKKYADSIGVAATALSEAGKRQAIMNEAIAQGKSKLGGVNVDIQEATNTWTQLGNTIGDIGEVLTLAFERTMGPAVRQILRDIRDAAKETKSWLQSTLGEGAEAANAKVEFLNSKIESIKKNMEELNQPRTGLSRFIPIDTSLAAVKLKKDLEDLTAQLALAEQEAAKFKSTSEGGKKTKEDQVDREKQKQQEAQFQRELLALGNDRFQAQLAAANNLDLQQTLMAQKRVLLQQETQAKIDQVNASGSLSESQKATEIELINLTLSDKLKNIEMQRFALKEQVMQAYLQNSISTNDAISRSFETASARSKLALENFAETGKRVYGSFSNHAVSALQAVGAGQKSAGDAAKGFLFGILADEAQARGTLMLMSSIWPPNPIGIAGGAALIAFSGFLRSQSGGAGGGAIPGGGGTGGAGGGAGAAPVDLRPDVAQQQMAKAVNIQVQGNYFETEQTRSALVDMIRKNQDATDFKIQQIGG